MTWTPYAPDALGLGWFATREPSVQIDGASAGAATLTNAQATEDIAAVWLHLDWTGGTPADGYELAVYDRAALTEGNLSTATFRPGADRNPINAAAFDTFTGTDSSDLWSYVDQAVNVPGTYQGRPIPNQSLVFPLFGEGAQVGFGLAGINGALAGRAVVTFRTRALVAELVETPVTGGATFTPYIAIDGVPYLGRAVSVPSDGSPARVITAEWPANPATGLSWTPEDLNEFGSIAGQDSVGWLIAKTGTTNHLPVIFQAWAEVDSAPLDARVAVAVFRPYPGNINGWNRAEFVDPADGTAAPWAKAAGGDYLATFRRRVGSGWILWRRVLGDRTLPNGWGSGLPIFTAAGRLASAQAGNVAALGRVDEAGGFAVLLERDDAALSVDSQAYVSVNDDVSGRGGFFHYWTRVDAGQTLEQEVTPPSAVDVGYLRALVSLMDVDPAPTADLTVELLDRGSATVLGTLVFTVDDLDDTPTRWQVLEDYWPSVIPVTTDQLGLRFSSPAPAGEGWRVQVLSTSLIGGPGGPPADVGDVTFAAGVDALDVEGTEYLELTAAAQVHTLADPPTAFAAAPLGIDAGVDGCELSWVPTATVDGGGFAAYEVERTDDRTSWQLVARIDDESVAVWEDLEARLDVASTYRIRVRRVDGSVSPWSDEADAIPEGPGCGYVFTSNADETAPAVWYDTIGSETVLEFPEQVEVVQPIGRNGSLALRELEDRLDRFTVVPFIAGRGARLGTPEEPPETGQRAFDPLRIIAGNRRGSDGRKLILPYVCVRAPGGDRWFASLLVDSGTRTEPDGSYSMPVTVVETTDVPWTAEPAAEAVS